MIKSEPVIFTTYIFFANKITMTGSRANFLSPDSNGQGQHYWCLDNTSVCRFKSQLY